MKRTWSLRLIERSSDGNRVTTQPSSPTMLADESRPRFRDTQKSAMRSEGTTIAAMPANCDGALTQDQQLTASLRTLS